MGVVFQATQLALQRSVAFKAITPELAADPDFRERFQSESLVVASIDHPNVIPIYEAGELDGTLYLIMRWVDGTDLRTLLTTSGRVSPGRAIRLLRPVASALAATHRRGLVHRDIKPANILIARGDEEDEDHVYLTDFGIARRTDGESVTRTGVFVGTVDYTAPERFEGGKGDAASDIYSLGCVLFEALTGRVPYDRPTTVSKIYAHVHEPIPSARGEARGVPEQLDAIVAKAMAKRPEDRFGSAGELTAALGQAARALDTAERVTAAPDPQPDATEVVAPTVTTEEDVPTQIEPGAAATQPSAAEDAPVRAENAPARAQKRRTRPLVWLGALVLLSLAGVLIATFSDNPSNSAKTGAASASTTNSADGRIKLHGGGLTVGRTITLPGTPSAVSLGTENVWISLPDRGQLVRFNMGSGARSSFPASGRPTALAAGSRALWVAQAASKSLAQFNGDSGAQVHTAKLAGTPVAVALDQNDSTAWVADSSGAISHVDVGPGGVGTPAPVIGTPARSDPAATGIAWGEGSLWAANGATNGLVRVSLDTSGSSATFPAGPQPVAVAIDQGVWIANSNGHVTRFNPRAGQLRVNADVAVAPDLDAIAATDPGPFVWAISKTDKTVYQLTNTSKPSREGEHRVQQRARSARRQRKLGLGRNPRPQGHRDPVLTEGGASCRDGTVRCFRR